jgi:hypothetical protein
MKAHNFKIGHIVRHHTNDIPRIVVGVGDNWVTTLKDGDPLNEAFTGALKVAKSYQFCLHEDYASWNEDPGHIGSWVDAYSAKFRLTNKSRKDKTMSNSNNTLVALLQARRGMTTASVSFGDRNAGGLYTYKVPPHLTLEKDDTVVVQVNAHDTFKVGKVTKIDAVADIDPAADFTYRWVIQKVDTDFAEKMHEEEQLLERKFVQAELMQKLESVAKMTGIDIDKIDTPVLDNKA